MSSVFPPGSGNFNISGGNFSNIGGNQTNTTNNTTNNVKDSYNKHFNRNMGYFNQSRGDMKDRRFDYNPQFNHSQWDSMDEQDDDSDSWQEPQSRSQLQSHRGSPGSYPYQHQRSPPSSRSQMHQQRPLPAPTEHYNTPRRREQLLLPAPAAWNETDRKDSDDIMAAINGRKNAHHKEYANTQNHSQQSPAALGRTAFARLSPNSSFSDSNSRLASNGLKPSPSSASSASTKDTEDDSQSKFGRDEMPGKKLYGQENPQLIVEEDATSKGAATPPAKSSSPASPPPPASNPPLDPKPVPVSKPEPEAKPKKSKNFFRRWRAKH